MQYEPIYKATVITSIVTICAIMLTLVTAMPTAYAESDDKTITVEFHETHTVLSIQGLTSEDSVFWDIGDGQVLKGLSVKPFLTSGLHVIRAVVVTDNAAVYLEKYVGVYDDVPPAYVDSDGVYRYGIFTDSVPIVHNEDGVPVSWLSYDPDKRVLSGKPLTTGTYYVQFAGKEWPIVISESDLLLTSPDVAVDATVGDNRITATAKLSSDSTVRYTWNVRDLHENLVGYHEGRTLDIELSTGYYVLTLQQIGMSGMVGYSQLVYVDGEIINTPDEGKYQFLSYFFVILTVILLMIATITRNPLISISSVISAIITLTVII